MRRGWKTFFLGGGACACAFQHSRDMCSGAGSFVQDKVVGRREAQPAVLDVSELEWKANDAGEEPSQRTCVCVCVCVFFCIRSEGPQSTAQRERTRKVCCMSASRVDRRRHKRRTVTSHVFCLTSA